MGKNQTTSAIVDGLLKFLLFGGTVSVAIVAPNAIIALDKPLQKALKKFDARSRERELKRALNYMKHKQLISSSDYARGIKITSKGKKRVKEAEFNNLQIPRPNRWDKQWRIVFFDIPETERQKRVALTIKLRSLGFHPLQRSTWIFPFPCRLEIETVADKYKVGRYLTYIETSHIDNEKVLRDLFSNVLD